MIKKTVSYEDFNGEMQEEDFYFHLSKAELVELEASEFGGLSNSIKTIANSQDGKVIIETFKKVLTMAIGQKSPDGKRFIKNGDITSDFMDSPAYSELFMELSTDADKASEFVRGILPSGMTLNNMETLPGLEAVDTAQDEKITMTREEFEALRKANNG